MATLRTIALTFCCLLLTSQATADEPDPIVVVVSPGLRVENISLSTLRRLFMAERLRSETGERLVPFNQPVNSRLRREFERRTLGMSPDEVGRHWVDQRIRGDRGAPRTVPTPALALQVIVALPGGITYVRQSQATSAVKVLKVDGKAPGDPGYPLGP